MPSMWKRAMVYLGLADDEEYADYGEYDDVAQNAPPPQNPAYAQQPGYGQPAPAYSSTYGPEPGPVRMIPRDEPAPIIAAPEPTPFPSSAVRTIPQPSARLH